MKGERQLADLVDAARQQIVAGGSPEKWFDSIGEILVDPEDGSPDQTWSRLRDRAEAYADHQDDAELWRLIGELYTLSRWYLDRPVTRVKGVGEARAEKLTRLEIDTLQDLILHYPRSYTDRRFVDDIRDLEEDQVATVYGEVVAGGVVEGRKPRYEVRIGDDTGMLRVNFWNQTYLKDRITRNTKLFCTGKVEDFRGTMQMNNPDYEVIEEDSDLEESKSIKPIYPLTEGINLKQLSKWIERGLDMASDLLFDCVPADLRETFNLISYRSALRQIHQPEDIDSLQAARRRIIFEEFFYFHLMFALQSWNIDETPKPRTVPSREWTERFLRGLPFELTDDQNQALETIEDDLASDSPMHRLLQGDVGTGKTVVATASLLRVADNGYQTALMAPTEVLAEQHYRTLRDVLPEVPCDLHLLVGGMDKSDKQEVKERIETGEADLVVGTHSLIQGSVDFSDLGYVVIDEQHRFGVEQRKRLREKGPDVDMLIMSATPIPRSLAMTRYGDLKITTLESFPQGPKKITTELLDQTDNNRIEVYGEVRDAVEQGEKAFFVFPAVDETDDSELTPARDAWESARQSSFFDGVNLGLVHGQMSREEKQKVMEDFEDGTVQVLFSTTVIEVGIDVPEASYLVVHDAENFGLAQLHQLRGRIGRGGQQAWCYLLMDPGASEDSRERLEVLERTQDGFEVSREDLRLRGIGNLAGTRQAGFQPFELGNVWKHRTLLENAQVASEELVSETKGLDDPEVVLVRKKLEREYSDQQQYVEVG
ncbi:MAG: ATP-dependent DNA helicase RecG [bacterium]